MGGKKEMRRCVSLVENQRDIPGDLKTRAESIKNHMTTFCPISIQIEGCSDDEADDHNCKQQELNHGTSTINPQLSSKLTSNQKTLCKLLPQNASQKSSPSSLRSSPNFLEIPEKSDLSTVKATAIRLNLRTRTSSFMAWQSTWLDKSRAPPVFPVPAEAEGRVDKLTEERKSRINEALVWLKTELKEMQCMDQHLARQLLSLRQDMHELRLSRSCQQHQDLLDDVHCEMQEQDEMADVLDLPNHAFNHTLLQHVGVTRLNLCARRFSTC